MTQTLKDIGLPPLQERRLFNRISFFHKVSNGLVPAIPADIYLNPVDNKRRIKPKHFAGYVSKNLVVNRSRNKSKCFANIEIKCEQYKNSFFPKTIKDWNALDNNIVNETKHEPFKSKLKFQMFE